MIELQYWEDVKLFEFFVEVGHRGKNKPNTLLKQAKIQVQIQIQIQLYKYESVYRMDVLGGLVTDTPKTILKHIFSQHTVFLKSTFQLHAFDLDLGLDIRTRIHLKTSKKTILNLSFCFFWSSFYRIWSEYENFICKSPY